jgi:predicted DNA-binding protein
VYWYASTPFERDGMTINPHSVEYLDLFAIVDGEPSEIFNSLSENISKLKSYINGETFTDTSLRQALNSRIDALSSHHSRLLAVYKFSHIICTSITLLVLYH